MSNKIVFIVTVGKENPEKATIPFILGNAALASDVNVVYFLQRNGVLLAKKGYADGIQSDATPPLKELLKNIISSKVPIYLCSPCAKSRGNLRTIDRRS
ncbi:MAG: DsrE family protein [Candidatus Odinarchaeia archaeon]